MNESLSLESQLREGLQALKLNAKIDPYMDYLHLLQKWNQAYNLTSIRRLEDMVRRHLLDSLAILPWLKGPHVLDVGSGAGFPGIPLAIACPDLQMVLIDSNGKKIRFLQQVIRVLNLDNVSIVQTRAEQFDPSQRFDTIVSRALSTLRQLVDWTEHLRAKSGIWLAMKGRKPDAELQLLDRAYKIIPYKVPSLEDERCCVIIE